MLESTYEAVEPAEASEDTPDTPVQNLGVPPVIAELLRGPDSAILLRMAAWLRSALGDGSEKVYIETPLGDIRFEAIEWVETPGFLKLVVHEDRMPFKPKPMVSMLMRRNDTRLSVTCVSSLMPLIEGLPFSELIMVVDDPNQQTTVEKHARIQAGVTPSVVSGKPSTGVDNDEPVADGEKSAAWLDALDPDEDFDVSRDDCGG